MDLRRQPFGAAAFDPGHRFVHAVIHPTLRVVGRALSCARPGS
jgi:hypothetical protein